MRPSLIEINIMANLQDDTARNEILNRLRRAEGQLRGVQRMVQESEDCAGIVQQLSAVRRALDSTQLRLLMCVMQQELQPLMRDQPDAEQTLEARLAQLSHLLSKSR